MKPHKRPHVTHFQSCAGQQSKLPDHDLRAVLDVTSRNVFHNRFLFCRFVMLVAQTRSDSLFLCNAELKVTVRSPKRVLRHGVLAPQCRSISLPKSGYDTKDLACTGGALNNYSDQHLLLDIPVNARHTEAELLYQPSQLSSVTCSSTSMGGIGEGEGCLKQS
jgi:hypothetical protein